MNEISLNSMIDVLCKGSKLKICIHDFTGLLASPLLRLERDYKIHQADFCNLIKDEKNCGDICLDYKDKLIYKAMADKKPFEDVCPFGMHQLVYPIIVEGTVRGVLYISNITKNKHITYLRAKSAIKSIDEDVVSLNDIIDGFETFVSEERYLIIAKLIENQVRLLYESSKKDSDSRRGEWIVEQMKEDAENYYSGRLSVKSEASRYFYNEKYIGRLFKKKAGKTFNSWLNEVRLKHACRYLEEGDTSVIDIAESCGFDNVTHFNRVFKVHFNCTPTQYRERVKKPDITNDFTS